MYLSGVQMSHYMLRGLFTRLIVQNETESCYCSLHLFLPLSPCWEQQSFQRMVQWQVKAHNFMLLPCFNTKPASVEPDRLRQKIQSFTWAVLKTDNYAVDLNFFLDLCRDVHWKRIKFKKYNFGWDEYLSSLHNNCLLSWQRTQDRQRQKKCLNCL